MSSSSPNPVLGQVSANDQLTWVRTRLTLEQGFMDSIRHGFSLIAAGFGSFSIFEGITLGERHVSALPKTFALIVTVIGMIAILLAANHQQRMTAWVDAQEFATGPVPQLPNDQRPYRIAAAAVIIGVVSFVALLLLPS